jgi:uncharacterized protein YehS (DUF1456 family)
MLKTKISARRVQKILAAALGAELGTEIRPEQIEFAFREEERTAGFHEAESQETVNVFDGIIIRRRN